MKRYILTMRIETEGDISEEQIKEEIYDACAEVPFGFDITGVEEA